jgi:small multidrug resistance pump
MSWIYLITAIVLEVSGTTCMKISHGFTRLVPSVLMFVFYGLSLSSLTMALKRIEVSVAYAVWSAVGTALIATIGIVWFRETLNLMKVASLGLIILGVVGLHLSHGAGPPASPGTGDIGVTHVPDR